MKNILLIIVGLLLMACASLAQTEKPNIIIILTDDQGYADVSYSKFAKKEVKTPNIDKLSKSGMTFTNAYVNGANCSPSRIGIMLGKYPHRVGVYNAGDEGEGAGKNEKFFPAYLKPKGYVTGAFGKWHMGGYHRALDKEYYPNNRGFDYFYGFLGLGGHSYFDLKEAKDPRQTHTSIRRNETAFDDTGYLTDRIGDEAIKFIKENKSKPMFMYVAFNAVHYPMEAPDDIIEKYKTDDTTRNTLLAMLEAMDKNIGRIIKTLEDEKILDNTIIFYCTDNGGSDKTHADNTPLRKFKQSTFEGGIRVPMIISWQRKIKAGSTSDAIVCAFDFLPTALDIIGIPLDEKNPLDGKSLTPVLFKGEKSHHEKLFWQTQRNHAARIGDWKYVYDMQEKKDFLFNIKEDISETNDLSAKNPEKFKELKEAHKNWLAGMAPRLEKTNQKKK